MLRRVEFMLEKANNVKLYFIVLSRTQTYLANPFYYKPGTLNINHIYSKYFF